MTTTAFGVTVTNGWIAKDYNNDGSWELSESDNSVYPNASTSVWNGTGTLVTNAATNFINLDAYISTPNFTLNGTGGDSYHDIFGDAGTDVNASWEFVYRPTTFTGNTIIFEMGGENDGVTLRQYGSVLNFRYQDSGSEFVSYDVDLDTLGDADDFFHVIALTEVGTTGTNSALYINGVQQASGPDGNTSIINDWAGGDGAGIGSGNETSLQRAGSQSITGPFQGDLAILRHYNNQLLTQGDVTAAYNTLIPEPSSLALLAMGGLAMLRRRR